MRAVPCLKFYINVRIKTFKHLFDNMKFVGDVPFSIYFDFKTTADKKVYNFEEDASLYPVSYTFVVAFHHLLNLEKLSVVRSFNHTYEQLIDDVYLFVEMLPFVGPITTKKLRDCASKVFQKKKKYVVSEMFSCELKFVIDMLKKGLTETIF